VKPLSELRGAVEVAENEVRAMLSALDATTDETPADELDTLAGSFDEAKRALESARADFMRAEQIEATRASLPSPEAPPAEKRSETKVGAEAPEYRPDVERSFYADQYRAAKGDHEARARLERNQEQVIDHLRRNGRNAELRDVLTSGGGAGFIPPAYLTDLYADVRTNGRPLVDVLPKRPLPDGGMTITIPRMLTGPTTAVQDPEGAGISETDVTSDQLSVPVVTIAGMQDFTQQLLERSDPSFDALITAELMKSYQQTCGVQSIRGSGSDSQHRGIREVASIETVTWTEGSPTTALLLPKVYDAIQRILTNYKAPATHLVMHPRRAAWLASSLSSTFPLVQQGSLNQAVGTQNIGTALTFAGLPVVQDHNILTTYGAGTNEDEIYVIAADAMPWMEGAIRSDMHEQILGGELKVRVRLFAYSAFASARYPKAIAKIAGTGLVSPSF